MKKQILFLMAMVVAVATLVPAQAAEKESTLATQHKVVEPASKKGGAAKNATPVENNDAVVSQSGEESTVYTPSKMASVSPAEAESKAVDMPGMRPVVTSPSGWYVGVGGGLTYMLSTFESIAPFDTTVGYNGSIFGGYRFNNILSLELSLSYMATGGTTSCCCKNLYLYNGETYYSQLSGVSECYSYRELESWADIYQVGAHLPINLFGMKSNTRRVNFLFIPAVYGAYYDATVYRKSDEREVLKGDDFVIGGGADIAMTYDISDKFAIRLQTGYGFYLGEMDAMPTTSHENTYLWNSSLNFVFKL